VAGLCGGLAPPNVGTLVTLQPLAEPEVVRVARCGKLALSGQAFAKPACGSKTSDDRRPWKTYGRALHNGCNPD
jgi:hypothetical protein